MRELNVDEMNYVSGSNLGVDAYFVGGAVVAVVGVVLATPVEITSVILVGGLMLWCCA